MFLENNKVLTARQVITADLFFLYIYLPFYFLAVTMPNGNCDLSFRLIV